MSLIAGLREWIKRFGGTLRPHAFDAQLEEELRSHVAFAEEQLGQGGAPSQARRAARLRTGGVAQAMEELRDQRRLPWLADAVRDTRYALRTLRRSPGFTVVAVTTLALGIGAMVSMFSIVDAVLLRPLAFFEPERLYSIRTALPVFDARGGPVNARHFHEWRMRCQGCADTALVAGNGFTLTGQGEPERLPGLEISFNFFRTLGVSPALGRDFTEQDEGPGRARIALLSDAFWRRRFSADPTVVGRRVVLNGEPVEIVGIMSPALHLPRGAQWGPYFAHNLAPQIFLPFQLPFAGMRGLGDLNYAALVRVRPGVTAAQAGDEMLALISDFTRQMTVETRVRLVPLREQVTWGARDSLWLLMSGVGVVLIIVCINVGTLMLMRATNRTREISVRLALGGSRASVLRLALVEAMVLAVCGGGTGVLLALAAVQGFVAAAPIELPRLDEVSISWLAFLFAAMVTTASGALSGLFPAWHVLRTERAGSLKPSAPGATARLSKWRLGDVLVGIEAAASALLLIVGGLLLASFVNVLRIDTGVASRHVVTIAAPIGPQLARYQQADARNQFVERALDGLQRIAGVEAVGVTTALPLQGQIWINDVIDMDQPPVQEPLLVGNYRFVSPDYFSVMSIALKQGRSFEAADRNRSVVVVSEAVVQRLWPGTNPIGKRLRRGTIQQPIPAEVVGIVANVRAELEEEAPLTVYEPYWNIGPGGPSFVIRTSIPPAALLPQVRAVIAALDPELPLHPARTIEQILDDSVRGRHLQTSLVVLFALSALFVAALGVYGVIAASVGRRTKELSLRASLGARPRQIFVLVMRQGLVPPFIGMVIGSLGALAVSRLLGSQLYGISPNDPVTFLVASAVLAIVSALACWLPARWATRVDPVIALRAE